MIQLVKLYRKFKKAFPRLAGIVSGYRTFRELGRTMGLLHAVQLVSSTRREAANGQTVLFNTVRTYMPYQICAELILALKLYQRGYRVLVLYDDGVLVHHDTLTKIDVAPFRTVGFLKSKLSLAMLKRLPVIRDFLVPYSKYYKPASDLAPERFPDWASLSQGDIDLLPFVEASLVRFYLSAPDRTLLEGEPDFKRTFDMHVKNSLRSLAVAREVRKLEEPDLMVTSHGIYSTYGPFFEQMKAEGVRCICYGGNGYAVNAIDLALNDVAANKGDGGFFDHFVSAVADQDEFQQEMFEKVDQLMTSRVEGRANDIARFGVGVDTTERPELQRIRRLKAEGKRVFGLFPNVMWDNATTFKSWNRVFDSPVEWLVETVRHVEKTDDLALVIRIHPAEHVWMPVRKSIRDILMIFIGPEAFSNDRIIIIDSQTSLPSYRLFEYLSGGLVYNGTIGPELIYANVPLIIGARAAYSDKGFTHDIFSRQEYYEAFDITKKILQLQREKMPLVRMFLYEYFFLHGVPVQFLSSIRQFSPNTEGHPEDIWFDPNLEHIIDTMVGQKQFFQQHFELPLEAEAR